MGYAAVQAELQNAEPVELGVERCEGTPSAARSSSVTAAAEALPEVLQVRLLLETDDELACARAILGSNSSF